MCTRESEEENRVFVMPPAEDTFVSAREAGRCLHALMAGNSIKCVLVTPPSPPQHTVDVNKIC